MVSQSFKSALPFSSPITVTSPSGERPSSFSFPRHEGAPPSPGDLSSYKKPRASVILRCRKDRSLMEQLIQCDQKCLSELSSWGIGGPCRYFLQTSRASDLAAAVRYCRERCIRFLVIGKGSNCLFDDRGFDGLVMHSQLNQLQVIEPGVYRVGSGFPFNRLGLEFAGGIPGTAGGAVIMNAGANSQETGDVVDSVEMITTDGELQVLQRSDLVFGYRWSSFQSMNNFAAIAAVTFRLKRSVAAREQQRAFLERRKRTQPIGDRSAGSLFQNPKGVEMSAGKLIELAGFKGFAIGGAKVSEIHANFFINFDGSTSKDMLALINHVKERVDQQFQIELREEVKYVSS